MDMVGVIKNVTDVTESGQIRDVTVSSCHCKKTTEEKTKSNKNQEP
jgi:hypothetical protein